MRLPTLFVSLLLFAAATWPTTTAFAQNQLVINGTAKGAEGKTIILKSYADNLTLTENFLGKTTIDSLGNFQITCKVYTTTLAIIHIEYYTGELYLEPGHNLTIEIKKLVFNNNYDKINYNLNPLTCYIKIASTDPNDLNHLVQKLNINYNRFFRDNIYLMKNERILPKIDTFLIAIADTFAGTTNKFFNDYLRYRLASLRLLTNYSDNQKLMLDYLYQQPILYDNVEYMSFLSDYFENYFDDLTRPVIKSDLSEPINNHNLAQALDVLGKDSMLRNEKLREIVLLKTLDVLYATPGFSKQSILSLLTQMVNTTKFDPHKLIARNMIWQYTHFNKGVTAPYFALKNAEDTTVKLSDFKGKIVYINFYASWCTSCLDELEMMKKLHDKYHSQITFISIDVDREPMKMYYFARDKKYDWTFLHFNNDYELLENFGVYAYPSFVLIDENGKFIQCPALKPSENIESVFNEVLAPSKQN